MICKWQKVGGRQSLATSLPLNESVCERRRILTQASVSSPEPSFVMLRKLVEETDSKFLVTHEEVRITTVIFGQKKIVCFSA